MLHAYMFKFFTKCITEGALRLLGAPKCQALSIYPTES